MGEHASHHDMHETMDHGTGMPNHDNVQIHDNTEEVMKHHGHEMNHAGKLQLRQ